MKTLSRTMLYFLPFISFSCLAQQDNEAEKSNWEVGFKVNSMKTNIPDPYDTYGGGTWVHWENDGIKLANYTDKSHSIGGLIKRKVKSFTINIRIDYGSIKMTGSSEPEMQADSSISFETLIGERSIFTVSPQIEGNYEMPKWRLVYGFELPLTFYGDEKISNTIEYHKNNQVISGEYYTGLLKYGTTIGVGLFTGFYFKLSKTISLGGILFSSIDYYSNKGTSYIDHKAFTSNPTANYDYPRAQDNLNYKSIVYSPVNLSFILSYKIY